MAQMIKNLPAVKEIQVQSLGWEDPVEKRMDSHSEVRVGDERSYPVRGQGRWLGGLDNRNRAVQLQTCFNLQEKERMTLKVTEVHEATILTIGPRPRLHLPWLQRVGHFQKAVGLMPCEVIGVTVPLSHAGKPATPVNLEGRTSNQRGYSWDL